jgi:peptide/nickel transport system permease protein
VRPGIVSHMAKDYRVWICGGYLILLVLVSIFATLVAPHADNTMDSTRRLQAPSGSHLLGTDEFGRDTLSRLIQGSRLTLKVSLGSVLISSVFGTLFGLTAGYYGRWVENSIMRLMDAILCFPPILLAIFVVVFLGPTVNNLILVIGLLYVPRFARVVHGITLVAKEQDYVEAARSLGASVPRILFKGILPNIMAPIFVQMSLSLGSAVLTESGLSFLGLGPPPPTPSWGRMIEQSSRFMHLSPHIVLWPSIMISLTVLAFNILGDAIRDNLDPRLRT